jgi:hypothetical protein
VQPSRYKQSGIVPVIGKLLEGNRDAYKLRDLEVGFLRPDECVVRWLTSFVRAVFVKLEVKACIAQPKDAGRDGDSVGGKDNTSSSAMPRLRVAPAFGVAPSIQRLAPFALALLRAISRSIREVE